MATAPNIQASPHPCVVAEQVRAIVARELAGPRWSANARADLTEIKSLATAVLDHAGGHEGFEDCPAALDAAIEEWSERADYRTFADVPPVVEIAS